jgi:hypothetical protein
MDTQIMNEQATPLAIDLGNRFVKICGSNGLVKCEESTYAEVFGSDGSAVRYVQGGCKELVGKSWVVGSAARHYRKGVRTWMAEKSEVAPRIVFGALEPPRKQKELKLDLVMSLPSPEYEGQKLQVLKGEHLLLFQESVLNVAIESVTVMAEGQGAYQWSVAQGLTVPDTWTGMIDLGGGTAIASLYDQSGRAVAAGRVVMRRGGSYGLSSDLAADPRLKDRVQGTPRIEVIMDGIANGSYEYGANGISFADFFDEHRQIWLKHIISEALNRWDEWIERVGRILVVGGAAPLAQEWLQETDWIRLVPDPQFAQVKGLLPRIKELKQLQAVA